METAYFPMFVDISAMKILIAGGGKIAVRRVKTLILFAKDITVVAPEICPEMEELVCSGTVYWVAECYSQKFLAEKDMVLAATDNHEVNRKIVEDCREREKVEGRKILVNTADDKTQCDFFFPSIVQKDEIVVGINSGGRNPGKVSRTRKKVEEIL